MVWYNESTPSTQTPEKSPYIIEYPGLVDVVQLSVARNLNVRGALEATRFSDVLSQHDASDRQEIIREVGAGFDQALIQFVTASLIGRGRQDVVILADASDGVEGSFPWESKLHAHLEALQNNGVFRTTTLHVERYTTDDETIATLTENAQALADDATPEYHHA